MNATTTATKTFPVALVNITDGTVSGHKAGCADLKRGNLRKHADDAWELEVEDKAEAWTAYNSDFLAESGRDAGYQIQWAACAKHVPAGDEQARYDAMFGDEDSTEVPAEQPATAVPAAEKPAARAAGTTEKVTLKSTAYKMPKGYQLKYPHGGYDLLSRTDKKGTGPAWYVTCNTHGTMTTADTAKQGDALGKRDALSSWCKSGDHKPAAKATASTAKKAAPAKPAATATKKATAAKSTAKAPAKSTAKKSTTTKKATAKKA